MIPSVYQQAIYDFVSNGTGNAIIRAVAGSGKTTTIVNAMKQCRGSVVFLAFNKAIATELGKRGVNAKTFHGLCYMAVKNSRKAADVTSDKLEKLCRANLTGDSLKMYGPFIKKLVSLAKNAGIGAVVDDVEQAWFDIIEHHGLELDKEGSEMSKAVELSRQLLAWSNDSDMIDFDDMLYLAVRDGLRLPTFNNIFVDELQDTNAIQRAVLRKLMGPFSRMFGVGDDAQSIYGFRGADSDSMNVIAAEFKCTELPLSVTYRCATAIVVEAQKYVSHIQAREGAPEGEVRALSNKEWDGKTFRPLDLVVCRNTKPLFSLCYKLVRENIPVQIMGRDIGEGMKSLIEKMNARGVDMLAEKLNNYKARECEKAKAKGDDARVEAISDKVDTVLFMIETLSETNRTVPALMELIDWLFADKSNAVMLSSIHKSKGLEADRVFWLNSEDCPSKYAKKPWQIQQEMNLCYVAITRAKTSLTYISDKAEF